MKRITILIVLVVLNCFTFGSMHLRGGIVGGDLALGIDSTSAFAKSWYLGYGAYIHSGSTPATVFMSFSNPLHNNPAYISFGPMLSLGNTSALGAYINLGWANILSSKDLGLETGIEIINNHSGINLTLVYQL